MPWRRRNPNADLSAIVLVVMLAAVVGMAIWLALLL